jgi:hypothetical protein
LEKSSQIINKPTHQKKNKKQNKTKPTPKKRKERKNPKYPKLAKSSHKSITNPEIILNRTKPNQPNPTQKYK